MIFREELTEQREEAREARETTDMREAWEAWEHAELLEECEAAWLWTLGLRERAESSSFPAAPCASSWVS
jgi:hypothetical protein